MFKALPADASTDATEHWWHQRLTAGANLLLLLWFVASIALLGLQAAPLDGKVFTGWAAQSIVAIPLLLLVGATIYHFRLGLQVLIEDYAKGPARAVWLVLVNFFAFTVAAWSILAILKLALVA